MTDILLKYPVLGMCPFEGEIFKPCGASCRQNCTSVLLKEQVICSPVCVPGCDCPAGQVRSFCFN